MSAASHRLEQSSRAYNYGFDVSKLYEREEAGLKDWRAEVAPTDDEKRRVPRLPSSRSSRSSRSAASLCCALEGLQGCGALEVGCPCLSVCKDEREGHIQLSVLVQTSMESILPYMLRQRRRLAGRLTACARWERRPGRAAGVAPEPRNSNLGGECTRKALQQP